MPTRRLVLLAPGSPESGQQIWKINVGRRKNGTFVLDLRTPSGAGDGLFEVTEPAEVHAIVESWREVVGLLGYPDPVWTGAELMEAELEQFKRDNK